MKISVVLPILNEEKIIVTTIKKLITKLSRICTQYEIIAVNDGSEDNTIKKLKKLQKNYQNLTIIDHKVNKGYGAAFQSGVRVAKYEWILFIDSDMQFDVNDLDKFIQHITANDFIIGYRSKRADNIKRIVISKVYNYIVSLLFGLKITDIDCAFKLMKKSSIQKLGRLPNSFFISTALLVKAISSEVIIKELSVKHLPRTKGSSTVTLAQVIRTMKDLAVIYTQLTLNQFFTNFYLLTNKFSTEKKYE